jgi:hypothetical protein
MSYSVLAAAGSFSRLLGNQRLALHDQQLAAAGGGGFTWHGRVELLDRAARWKIFRRQNPVAACAGTAAMAAAGLSEIHCTHFAWLAPERYLCMPIVAHGNTLGMLYVQVHSRSK